MRYAAVLLGPSYRESRALFLINERELRGLARELRYLRYTALAAVFEVLPQPTEGSLHLLALDVAPPRALARELAWAPCGAFGDRVFVCPRDYTGLAWRAVGWINVRSAPVVPFDVVSRAAVREAFARSLRAVAAELEFYLIGSRPLNAAEATRALSRYRAMVSGGLEALALEGYVNVRLLRELEGLARELGVALEAHGSS